MIFNLARVLVLGLFLFTAISITSCLTNNPREADTVELISPKYNNILQNSQICDITRNDNEVLRILITSNSLDIQQQYDFMLFEFINTSNMDTINQYVHYRFKPLGEISLTQFEVTLPDYFFQVFQPRIFDSLNLCEYWPFVNDGESIIYDYKSDGGYRVFFDRPILGKSSINNVPKADIPNMKLLDHYYDYLFRIIKETTEVNLNDSITRY